MRIGSFNQSKMHIHLVSEDLMTAIAYLYHEPIPDVFVDFDINKVGVEDLSALLSILEGSGITGLGRQSTSPFRVKRQNVELWELSRKVFRLNKNLVDFFEKVEETFSVVPEDYILSFSKSEEKNVRFIT